MSSDPHAPTPAGPDPDDAAEVGAGARPTPTVTFAAATAEHPAGTAAPAESGHTPVADAGATVAADPLIATPAAFTPPGTPDDGQARALTGRPEVMVGLAFAGGALASLVLRRLGR